MLKFKTQIGIESDESGTVISRSARSTSHFSLRSIPFSFAGLVSWQGDIPVFVVGVRVIQQVQSARSGERFERGC
jgi:hypothetical protein